MSRVSAVVRAPCKLNLYLYVLGRRGDGYHDIVTVMQTISLSNTVRIVQGGDGIALSCNLPGLPLDSGNTAYRAAVSFAVWSGIAPSWRIELKKEAPFKAGMGSASADAAGVLAGLNAICGHPLSSEKLLAAGAQVGADVPFLLTGGTALCEGIGERITPLKPLGGLYFVVVMGGEGFSTPEVFSRFDAERTPLVFTQDAMLKAIESERPGRVAKQLANRLEYCMADTLTADYKAMLLRLGAAGAAMTGSGAAVFGAFLSLEQAKSAAAKAKKEAAQVFGGELYINVVRPVATGPLIELRGGDV